MTGPAAMYRKVSRHSSFVGSHSCVMVYVSFGRNFIAALSSVY